MPITEGTQPAVLTWTGAWTTNQTTASFTPESGALLVALVAGDSNANTAVTASVTDSLSGTWTLLKRQNTGSSVLGGLCEVWCRDSPGSALTVSVKNNNELGSGSTGGQLAIRTLIGAKATASQNGATGGASPSPGAVQVSVAAGTGNKIYGAALNYDTSTAMTALANTTVINAFGDTTNGDTWEALKSAGDTAGTATYGFSTSLHGMIAAAEIVAAPAAATGTPVTRPKPGIYPGRPPRRAVTRGIVPPPAPSTGTGTANLTGTGVLGDVQVIQGAVAFAGGAGTLTATGSSASPGSATLTGAGILTATGGSAPPVASIAQAGAGVFPSRPPRRGTWRRVAGTVAQTSTVTGSATITGTGALTALAVQQATAALTGAGALTVPAVQQSGTALTGAGTLGPVLVTQQATVTLAGAGNLTAVSGAFTNGTAVLTAAGVLSATGSTVTLGPAAMAAAGTVAALGVQGATAAVAGAGALAAPVTLPGMGALTGAGALAATGSQHAPNIAAKSNATVSDKATSLSSVTDPRDGTPGVT